MRSSAAIVSSRSREFVAFKQQRHRKLRLLCLHGMYQNEKVFARKTRLLCTELDDIVEFVYLNAPVQTLPKILRSEKDTMSLSLRNKSNTPRSRQQQQFQPTDFRSWWETPLNLPECNLELLETIKKEITNNNNEPIDGVLGFSQGAALASLLCTPVAKKVLGSNIWNPKLAIFMNGYTDISHQYFEDGLLPQVASLHLWSDNDRVVSSSKSQDLASYFSQQLPLITTVHQHSQGHVVPNEASVIEAIRNLSLQITNKL